VARRVAQTVTRTAAIGSDGLVNWPHSAGQAATPATDVLLLQHCFGAPGMVTCTSYLLADGDAELDALLLAGGELTWRAGPPKKLPSLCHGAPGSGYAFLELFAHTGDERWLERARRFAMHAIEQAERAREQHGQRKFSLWTGDLGLALYLADCRNAAASFPTLDVF
jgi:hypothetical protein